MRIEYNCETLKSGNINFFCGFKHRLYDFEIDIVTELAAFCILANSRLDEQLSRFIGIYLPIHQFIWCLVLERQILFDVGEQF